MTYFARLRYTSNELDMLRDEINVDYSIDTRTKKAVYDLIVHAQMSMSLIREQLRREAQPFLPRSAKARGETVTGRRLSSSKPKPKRK